MRDKTEGLPVLSDFYFIPHPSALIPFIDAFELDVFVQACDDHAFADFEATGKRSLVVSCELFLVVIPELAIRAVAVPAEVAVRDAPHREKLEAAQQAVVLRHFDVPTENLNRHQSLVWLKEIAVNQEGF